MANIDITQDLVKEFFDYKDGFLYWKKRTNAKSTITIGIRAGSFNKSCGRYRIVFRGKGYFSSRLIFLWNKGYFPEEVDHKDRNRLNDRIENLRAATRIQNCRNRKSFKGSSSKYFGVSFKTKKVKYRSRVTNIIRVYERSRWAAQISIDGKRKEIGLFKTEIEAAIAYNKKAKEHYREFASINIITT